MGKGTPAIAPFIIEVDNNNNEKDIDRLDIRIPLLSPNLVREYKNFNDLDLNLLEYEIAEYKEYSESEKKKLFLGILRLMNFLIFLLLKNL